jgi:predicted dehydrogenase
VTQARPRAPSNAETAAPSSVGIGVIGYGYWGPNLVRNFAETEGARVVAVSDLAPAKLVSAARRHPGIETFADFRDLLRDPRIDAVVVATPVASHYELGLAVLQAGKHLLLEKPMAETSEQAQRLLDESLRRRLVLMVDHTFVYTAAVRKIRELVNKGQLGTIYYYDSTRVNLGLFQRDINVIWDLAVHDLSIMDHVLDHRPLAVSANGARHVTGRPENMAYVTVFCEDNLIAHINVNWLAPVKVRKTLIGGSSRMIVFDDLEPSEKVKVYDKGVTVDDQSDDPYQMLVGYRLGDMWAPHIPTGEALRTEALHFVDCIESGRRPITDGAAGLRIVGLLEAATRSMRRRGEPVDLAPMWRVA